MSTGPPPAIEPPTTARVILQTSRGPLEFELWAKETPIACRNFLQRCAEGYYNGSSFHRLIRNFIVQGGSGWRDDDDENTSALPSRGTRSRGFPDEFHSRLKFNRRGMLGTANIDGVRNSNGSQFIITLAPEGAPQLNRKNTVFGRITPETIYTLVEITSDVEMTGKDGEEGDDRPLYPVKIISSEILEPYFDDIQIKKPDENQVTNDKQKIKSTTKSGVKVKQKVRLAYGDEEEEENEASINNKARESGNEDEDLGPSLNKNKRKFVMKTPVDALKKRQKEMKLPALATEKKSISKEIPSPQTKETVQPTTIPIQKGTQTQEKKESKKDTENESQFSIRDTKTETKGISKPQVIEIETKSATELNDEFEQLKAQLKKKKTIRDSDNKQETLKKQQKINTIDTDDDLDMTKYFANNKSRMKNKPKGSELREAETLAMLNNFKRKLGSKATEHVSKKINTGKQENSKNGSDENDSDKAGENLSDEETGDPYDLYAHKFIPSGVSTNGDGRKEETQNKKSVTYEGITISRKDAALITQDDTKNRKSAKYSLDDPEGLLNRKRNTEQWRPSPYPELQNLTRGQRDKERQANKERKSKLLENRN